MQIELRNKNAYSLWPIHCLDPCLKTIWLHQRTSDRSFQLIKKSESIELGIPSAWLIINSSDFLNGKGQWVGTPNQQEPDPVISCLLTFSTRLINLLILKYINPHMRIYQRILHHPMHRTKPTNPAISRPIGFHLTFLTWLINN